MKKVLYISSMAFVSDQKGGSVVSKRNFDLVCEYFDSKNVIPYKLEYFSLSKKKSVDKIHKTKNNFNVFKKEKLKEKNKVKNKSFEKVKMAYLNKPKKKYKLQKKKKAPIAIFSTSIAAIFFTISLALISFKKLIHGMFVISPAAFLRKQTLKKQSKRLVKK